MREVRTPSCNFISEVDNIVEMLPESEEPKDAARPGKKASKNAVTKALDGVVNVTSSLPFAGKLIVTSSAVNASKEKKTHVKQVRLAKTLGLMGIMVPGHYMQTKTGVDAFSHLNSQGIDNPVDVMKASIDAAYIAANSMVTVTQAKIAARQVRRLGQNTGELAKDFVGWSSRDTESLAKRLEESLVTKDTNDINSLIVFKSKKKRKEVIEAAKQQTENPDIRFALEELEELSDNTSRRRAVKNILTRGLQSPRTSSDFYSGKEKGVMIGATLGGQAAFLYSSSF